MKLRDQFVVHVVRWTERLATAIEAIVVPFPAWLLSIGAVIAVRVALENLSSNRLSGVTTDAVSAFVHYPLFYLTALLAIALILHRCTGAPVDRVSKVAACGLILIWVAPIADLLINAIADTRYVQAYIVATPSALPYAFLTFFGPLQPEGITPGIRIEVATILLLVWWYVRWKTSDTMRALLAAVATYTALFVLVSLPSLVLPAYQATTGIAITSGADINAVFSRTISGTPLLEPTDFRSLAVSSADSLRAFRDGWTHLHAWTLFALATIGVITWQRRWDPVRARALWGNARFERIAYYLALSGIGIAIARATVGAPLASAGLWLSWLVLAIGITASWVLQVQINDAHDRAIDAVSNPTRPLVTGTLTAEDHRRSNPVLATIALLSGVSLGSEHLLLLAAWNAAAYIYSAPPLRLRRFFPISNILMGVMGITTILMGFSLASGHSFIAFPAHPLALLALALTLLTTVKDVKDAAGDRSAGVVTLCTLLPGRLGLAAIGGCLIAAGALAGLAAQSMLVGVVMVAAACLATVILFQQPYRERRLFALLFAALFVLLILAALEYQ